MSDDARRERDDPEPKTGDIIENGPDQEAAVVPQAVFHQLDPVAVKLWRFEGLTTVGILLLAAFITLGILWLLSLVPGWVALLVWSALGSLLYFSAAWYPPRKYSSWSYRLSEQVLELRYGVVWRTSVMIPLTRLQHIDLKRGPLDRRLGVASLEVHTAGTSHASHEIPCLDHETGLGLRERLIAAADLYTE